MKHFCADVSSRKSLGLTVVIQMKRRLVQKPRNSDVWRNPRKMPSLFLSQETPAQDSSQQTRWGFEFSSHFLIFHIPFLCHRKSMSEKAYCILISRNISRVRLAKTASLVVVLFLSWFGENGKKKIQIQYFSKWFTGDWPAQSQTFWEFMLLLSLIKIYLKILFLKWHFQGPVG